MSPRIGIETSPNLSGSGLPTRLRPRKAERPVPSRVRARPLTTWLARSPTVTTAWREAIAAPARIAPRIPTQALPLQIVKATPASAPISIIPSTPRLRTPERSLSSSPRQAKRIAVPAGIAAARTATRKLIDQTLSMDQLRLNRDALDVDPEVGQELASEQEEEDCALEHRSDRAGQADRGLELIAADQNDRHQEADRDDRDRVEAGEPGNDDRGVAVSGRDRALERVANSGDFAHPGDPGQCAADREDDDDHAGGAHAGVAGGAGVVADHVDLVAEARAAEDDHEHGRRDQAEAEAEVDAVGLVMGQGGGVRERSGAGEAKGLGIAPGAVDEVLGEEDRDVVEHQRRDRLVGVELRPQHAGNRAPERAADRAGNQHGRIRTQLLASGSTKRATPDAATAPR